MYHIKNYNTPHSIYCQLFNYFIFLFYILHLCGIICTRYTLVTNTNVVFKFVFGYYMCMSLLVEHLLIKVLYLCILMWHQFLDLSFNFSNISAPITITAIGTNIHFIHQTHIIPIFVYIMSFIILLLSLLYL